MPQEGPTDGRAGNQEDERTGSAIDLDAMQASALAVAIDRWVQSFEWNIPDNSAPSMSLRIGALSLVFSGLGRKGAAQVQLSLPLDRNGPVTTKLTRVEADVLGTLLDSLIGEEQVEGAQ